MPRKLRGPQRDLRGCPPPWAPALPCVWRLLRGGAGPLPRFLTTARKPGPSVPRPLPASPHPPGPAALTPTGPQGPPVAQLGLPVIPASGAPPPLAAP